MQNHLYTIQGRRDCLKLSIGINSKFCFGTNKLLLKDYLNENLSYLVLVTQCLPMSLHGQSVTWISRLKVLLRDSMNMNKSISELQFDLQISPAVLGQNWFCMQNYGIRLSFQEKKWFVKSVSWLLRHRAKFFSVQILKFTVTPFKARK